MSDALYNAWFIIVALLALMVQRLYYKDVRGASEVSAGPWVAG